MPTISARQRVTPGHIRSAPELPPLLRIATAQWALDCCRAHIYELIAAGQLEVTYLGKRAPRITRESVLAIIERNRKSIETRDHR